MPEPRDLVLISQARQALAKARTLGEVKLIRDKAEAIRMYARAQGESLELQNQAAEVKLRAERRAGELLAVMTKHNGNPSLRDARRLSDLGVDYTQSHRWQRIATLPEQLFEKHIRETVEAKDELTTAGALKLAKRTNGHAKAAAKMAPDTTHQLQDLIDAGNKFGAIYADPPWAYENAATRSTSVKEYRTMSVADICGMPIDQLAADDAHLHLWTTNAFLFDARAVMEAWGFEYRSVFVWVKPQMGIGNYWRVSHEFLLLGIRGDASRFNDKSLRSWGEFDRQEHSQKPEAVALMIEKASPGPYLELFGRRTRPGWTVWGNQVERSMFDAEAV